MVTEERVLYMSGLELDPCYLPLSNSGTGLGLGKCTVRPLKGGKIVFETYAFTCWPRKKYWVHACSPTIGTES